MKLQTKQHILRHLHMLKSLGYTYHENVNLHPIHIATGFKVPQNFEQLEDMVNNCSLCELGKYSQNRFFSYGSKEAKVVFIGNFPQSDMFDPFSGQAGKMFESMCENVLQLSKDDIYYTYPLKCQIPLSQEINKEDIDCCKSYLLEQLKLINPKVVVVYEDSTTLKYITKDISFYNVITTFSPNFLLRNPSMKAKVLADLKQVKQILEKEEI